MKRIRCFAAVFCLLLLLAGCAGQYRLRRGASPDGPGIRILGEGRGHTASRRNAAGGD